MSYIGDYKAGSTVRFKFTTHAATGAAVAPLTAFEAADLKFYKDGSATPRSSSNGITMTSPFNSITGLHHVDVDLTDNTDAGFWAAGHDYDVVLSPDTETVDGLTVVKVVAAFSIENRCLNWAQVVSPTTTVGLSGTTVKTATDVETDTQDIQSRLPAALSSGNMKSDVFAMQNDVITAAAIATNAIGASEIADGAIDAATFAANAITSSVLATDCIGAAQLAANAIGSSELATTAVDEIVDQVWDELMSGHVVAGSSGAYIAAAGGAGDPWATALPGAYGAGTAGKILGDNLNANVVSMAANVLTASALATDAVDEIRNGVQAGLYGDGAVWLNTVSGGAAGTTPYLNGTQHNPSDNLADTLTVAAAVKLSKVRFTSNGITLVGGINRFEFIGIGIPSLIDLNGQNVNRCVFRDCKVTGVTTSAGINNEFVDCVLGSGFSTGANARLERCVLPATMVLISTCYAVDCVADVTQSVFDFNSTDASLILSNVTGSIMLFGMSFDSTAQITGQGVLTIDASCTGGEVEIHGMWDIVDNSGGLVTITGDWTVPGDVTFDGANNDIRLGAGGLAQFFTTNTTKVYADAVAGSVVSEIGDNAGGSVTSTYQAKIGLIDDDGASADRWTVIWFKNGEPVTAGITSPVLQVFDASGSDLIASQAMTQIGSSGTYKYVSTDRVTSGVQYVAKATATIDGSTRTWYQWAGRDST